MKSIYPAKHSVAFAGVLSLGASAYGQTYIIVRDQVSDDQVLVRADSAEVVRAFSPVLNTEALQIEHVSVAGGIKRVRPTEGTEYLMAKVRALVGPETKVRIVPVDRMHLSTQDWSSE